MFFQVLKKNIIIRPVKKKVRVGKATENFKLEKTATGKSLKNIKNVRKIKKI